MTEYVAILIYLGLALVVAATLVAVNAVLGPPPRPSRDKIMPYESGIPPLMSARRRFHVRYHVIAMIFLVFDLEIAFIYPWAVVYRELGWLGFWEMFVFLGILVIGLLYAWKRGALRWE